MSANNSSKVISYEELSKHVTQTDCWVAIQGHVLNLTSYIAQNTNDKDFFFSHAGTDASHKLDSLKVDDKETYIKSLIEKYSVGTLDYNSAKVAPNKETNKIQRMYTYLEISQHNKCEDCWVIVHDKVFDVTKFLDEHPGGAALILEYGGADCTEPYVDHNHSHHATKLLNEYQVGVVDLNSKEEFMKYKSKQSKGIIGLVGVIVVLLVLGFIGYTQFAK